MKSFQRDHLISWQYPAFVDSCADEKDLEKKINKVDRLLRESY